MSPEDTSPSTHREPGLKQETRHKIRMIGFAILYLSVGTLIIGAGIALVQTYILADAIRSNQKTNTSVIRSSESTLKVVKDCTQPEGKCYKDGQKRTAAAVTDIGEATTKASIYAAYCVKIDNTQSIRAIEACVRRQFDNGPKSH